MSKSVAFLLGAGCEGNGQLGLPSGSNFKRDTIVANDVSNLIYCINSEPKDTPKIKNGTIIHHNNYSILYQTIVEYGLKGFNFSQNEIEVVNNYLDRDNKKNEDCKQQIIAKFKKLYQEKFYKAIKDNAKVENEISDDNIKFFLEKACFYSYVDSLFNHLRKPEKYQNEVNRVIKLYFAAYQSIIKRLFNEDEKKEYNNLLSKKEQLLENREILSNLVTKAQMRLIQEKKDDDFLYYNMIRRFNKEHSNINVSAITTNYTLFAEKLLDLGSENIAYVHGRLELFEDVNTKSVYTLDKCADGDFIFPFIFIQSGVKPIVNRYQIHEFDKAARMIEESDCLVILGYGVNSDDEHISNLLRERLRKGKEIICCLYENSSEEQESVKKELCANKLIKFYDSSDFSQLLVSLI